jgi:hypothetical protein
MAIATKSQPSQQRSMRRVWKAPISRACWLWFALSIALYAAIYAWYLIAIKTLPFVAPALNPLRLYGIIAFVMVLGVAAYTLRRRFMRGLPGMARDWLWMHTWLGILTVLIAFLHENYTYIIPGVCGSSGGLSCLSQFYFGPGALFALMLLVLSGIVGRLLDVWQARVIARDASTNGVGIAHALEERILELEYTVERLSAGKSEPFKAYCLQALETAGNAAALPVPPIPLQEQTDFARAHDTLLDRARLAASLQRQQQARLIFRTWRYIHMILAPIALLIILYHAILEIFTSILGVRFT